ncbi:DUF742 domain-containing protein [Streptomyces sp. NBC_01433]|uniref:DUF742 domain-containing protein n=1 Tax=Streptomyces sp. NBC_01433 TaxID=2903864 RepID=UPI00224D1389|nr:DUF742 domain-containing protein [Streptomyces sp. NBC_01433]MCX4682209.1 DUF742 domain-containing protein [Streptomyces sp. NBC_01433]
MSGHRGVRPFTWTAPRLATTGADDSGRIVMQTLIRTTAPADRIASVPEKWQMVLRLADRPTGIAVAEIAAVLRLKLTPTSALIAELETRELVTHESTLGDTDLDTDLLMRIRNGLEQL